MHPQPEHCSLLCARKSTIALMNATLYIGHLMSCRFDLLPLRIVGISTLLVVYQWGIMTKSWWTTRISRGCWSRLALVCRRRTALLWKAAFEGLPLLREDKLRLNGVLHWKTCKCWFKKLKLSAERLSASSALW